MGLEHPPTILALTALVGAYVSYGKYDNSHQDGAILSILLESDLLT
jgi:hypothetical protein